MTRLLPVFAFVLLTMLAGRAFAYEQAVHKTAGEPTGTSATVAQELTPAQNAPTGESASPAETSSRAASIRAIRLVFRSRADAAIRVARCETGGTFYARAVGNAGERGLFQIHPVHFSWAQPWRLFDPVWNSRVAYRLSRGGTRWGAWSCGWAA